MRIFAGLLFLVSASAAFAQTAPPARVPPSDPATLPGSGAPQPPTAPPQRASAVAPAMVELEARLAAIQGQRGAVQAMTPQAAVTLQERLNREMITALAYTTDAAARAPWSPQDPADSLYRVARDNFNRGEFRRAAEMFAQIPQRYPTSDYNADSYYYQAFALYKVGGQTDLRGAITALETLATKYPTHRSARNDAPVLNTRILGTLAAQGDANARQRLAQAAQSGQVTCDREEMAVRTEALSALTRMSPDSTGPILRTVFSRRDECSVPLRQNALILLSKQPEQERAVMLADVARTDPSLVVRREAVEWLGRTTSERSVGTLEAIVNAPADSALHTAALRALWTQNPTRAREMYRTILDNPAVSERTKTEVITSLSADTSVTAAALLRSTYTRTTSRTLKSRILTTLARRPNTETATFLTALAKNTTEPMEFRRAALQVAGSIVVPIQDVATLFDGITELDLRSQIVTALGVRREPQATDKLISIAKDQATPPEIRRSAISALTRKEDPRTKALLLEIIRGGGQ